MALPKFQSPTEMNCSSMRLPISTYCPPPSSFGITKLDIESKNTMIVPFTTPGMDSLNVTFQKAVNGFAPRSYAASMSE